MADEILSQHDCVDFVIDDPNGEVPFARLLQQLSGDAPPALENVPSLVFRKDFY